MSWCLAILTVDTKISCLLDNNCLGSIVSVYVIRLFPSVDEENFTFDVRDDSLSNI